MIKPNKSPLYISISTCSSLCMHQFSTSLSFTGLVFTLNLPSLASLVIGSANMRSKANKQNKFKQYIGAPFRILSKARDFYMRSMADCAGRVGYGSVMGCPVAPVSRLPKSFSAGSSKASNNEDLRELIRVVSKRSTMESKVELDMHRQPVVGSNGVGRSYSVGLGRIGKIDEDKPCEFEEEDIKVKTDLLYPRSRSYAVTKRNNVVLY